ncbi:MAG: hypothetical protein H6738_17905 [Alphaproteobacteria bacterium]|nr:hypothetical protein [Alphaproteobacteria bacterium]MCB9698661.1 hypothetical protein [Alphaproteobacteria bacterium]
MSTIALTAMFLVTGRSAAAEPDQGLGAFFVASAHHGDFVAPARDRSLVLGAGGLTVVHGGQPLAVDFVDADPAVHPRPSERAPTTVNVLVGPRSGWRRHLPTWQTLTYDQLWDGIDLRYTATATGVEYAFVVAAGADPGRIALRWRGAERATVDAEGGLRVRTNAGELREDHLMAWQGGSAVDVAFEVRDTPEGPEIGFRLGPYDPDQPLVIDPDIALWLGFLGGGSYDEGHGVAIDGDGAMVLTGTTSSVDFPDTPDALDPAIGGGVDAFVARIAADGSAMETVTFFGGNGRDRGRDVAVGPNGHLWLVGDTDANEASFPVTTGPDLTFNDQSFGTDVFVAELTADLSDIVYAGYLGGTQPDRGYAIAVDADGSAVVVGETASTDGFPAGGALRANCSRDCAFVARVAPGGAALSWAGFLAEGGAAAYDVVLDAAGGAWVTGGTGDGLWTAGDLGPDHHGGQDAFVARVASDGSLSGAGYVGGSGDDTGYGLALDDQGRAIVVGVTTSPGGSSAGAFPVTLGSFDQNPNGGQDAFVARLTADGVEWATFLGGSGDDCAWAVDLAPDGGVVVAGGTHSASNFPLRGGPDLTFGGEADGFLTRFSPDGQQILSSGFIGGTRLDVGTPDDASLEIHPIRVAVDGDGSAYVVGVTRSPLAPVGDLDPALDGPSDAFVAVFADDGRTTTTTTPGGSDTADPTVTTTDGVTSQGGRPGDDAESCDCGTSGRPEGALLPLLIGVLTLARRRTYSIVTG